MPDLLLPSLEIQNFRAFEHLRIERLGRVNLITGKNNVGKTSLLEALYLYNNRGAIRLFKELLDSRDELYSTPNGKSSLKSNVHIIDPYVISYLFNKRPNILDAIDAVVIGPVDEDKKALRISLEYYRFVEQTDRDNEITRKLVRVNRSLLAENPDAQPYLSVKLGTELPVRRSLEKLFTPTLSDRAEQTNDYIKAHGLTSHRAAELWGNVTLTPLEDDVTNALQIVDLNINRVNIIGEREDVHGPIAIVSVKGGANRIPLRSLGDGINRMFGLILSLVNVQNGTLLIDEIETGLHYSVMEDMWRLIFQVAQRLNVQVFATTHSWDCIEAFERAARENDTADGELIHLMSKEDRVFAVLYDEEELHIVTRELIEVR